MKSINNLLLVCLKKERGGSEEGRGGEDRAVSLAFSHHDASYSWRATPCFRRIIIPTAVHVHICVTAV